MKKQRMMGCIAAVLLVTGAWSTNKYVNAATMQTGEIHTNDETEEIIENSEDSYTEDEAAKTDEQNISDTNDTEAVEQTEDTTGTDDQETDNSGSTEEPPQEEIDWFELDSQTWVNAKLSTTYISRAKTTIYQLSIKNIPATTSNYKISWKTSNKKVATVDEFGNVTAIKKGVAIITCTVKTESGYEKRFTCEVDVTNPKFTQSTYVVAKGNQLQLEITGTETAKYTTSGSNDELLKVYKKYTGLVKGRKKGTVTVSAEVDGKTIQCKVIVTNPKVKKSLFVLTANQTASIEVYGQSGKTKVTYTSKNPKIATVSSKGKIKSLKTGVAVILVTADQKEFEITVAVGNSKSVTAIKNAQKALGSTYSQAYRMRSGYYDCSSLVWRCYVPTGITFGYSKYASNAPTAAGEAYYLVSHGKEVASSYVDEKYLKPGDLVFISSGNNGRYRNITHVAIYIGNDIIIHATPRNTNDVQYGTLSYYKNMIVSIGRPTA